MQPLQPADVLPACLPPPMLQVGPCVGISMGDDLWMSRYIIYRLAGEPLVLQYQTRPVSGADPQAAAAAAPPPTGH